MLVISRKSGESLFLSDNIKVTVVSVSGDKVVLGFDAPRDVKIVREELAHTIEANKASADTALAQKQYADLAALLKNKKTT